MTKKKKTDKRNKVPLSIRISPVLRRKIRDRAKKEKISVTGLCEESFKEYLLDRAAF
jgi:hypothetical protein